MHPLRLTLLWFLILLTPQVSAMMRHESSVARSDGVIRWLSEDPIGEEGGINLYGYVSNKPIGHWDPLGLQVPATNSVSAQPALVAELAAQEAGFANAADMAAAALSKAAQEAARRRLANAMTKCVREGVTHGKSSLERTIRSLTKRIAQHTEKIAKDPTSLARPHWEGEMETWKTVVECAQKVLKVLP